MRRKQLIILVAVMVLGLSGCKKKDNPIETQPSIESITPTESEQELSSGDISSDEIETFHFDASVPREGIGLDENGETYGVEESLAIESSENAIAESIIAEQGSGNITPTIEDMENKTPSEIAQAVEESAKESIAQRDNYETLSEDDIIQMGQEADNKSIAEAESMLRDRILRMVEEMQAQGIHDFDYLTADVLAGYSEEQLLDLGKLFVQ